jgi:hypothetical protein
MRQPMNGWESGYPSISAERLPVTIADGDERLPVTITDIRVGALRDECLLQARYAPFENATHPRPRRRHTLTPSASPSLVAAMRRLFNWLSIPSRVAATQQLVCHTRASALPRSQCRIAIFKICVPKRWELEATTQRRKTSAGTLTWRRVILAKGQSTRRTKTW